MSSAFRLARALLIPTALLACCLAADDPATLPAQVPVEFSKPLPPPDRGTLGTRQYAHTDAEVPFLERITEAPFDPWSAAAPATQSSTAPPPAPYTLAGQVGKYVGWFGIVRGNTWDDAAKRSTLLLQHQYFDGLIDTHLQIVSCFGAGDFHVVVPQKLDAIPPLALLRVYGKVSLDKAGNPVVTPEYIRVWDWPLFTFMNYGTDHSNPDWVKLRKVQADDVYSPRPSSAFYTDRLGPRP